MIGIPKVVSTVLREKLQIDRLVFGKAPREIGDFAGKLSFKCVPSDGGTRSGFRFKYYGSNNKTKITLPSH